VNAAAGRLPGEKNGKKSGSRSSTAQTNAARLDAKDWWVQQFYFSSSQAKWFNFDTKTTS